MGRGGGGVKRREREEKEGTDIGGREGEGLAEE